MPPNNANPSNAVIVERLDRIQKDICQIQETQKEQGAERAEFREQYAAAQVQIAQDVRAVEKDVAENKAAIKTNSDDIKTLDKAVTKLLWAYAILMFVVVTIGGVFLTGKAYIIFR